MSRIVLATGGARSGKSAWAERRAESMGARRVYIATAAPEDDEMRERIQRHQTLRAGHGWDTIEEPLELAGALSRASADYPVALVDCLTVWIANRMYEAEQAGREVTEECVTEDALCVARAASSVPGGVVFVSGEVGLGIVPDNAAARRFRDLLGVCNQIIAGYADEVTLLVCGQPLRIK